VSEIEDRIAALETRQQEIHDALQDPATYANGEFAAELNRELKQISGKLDELHRDWELEATKLESLNTA